MTEITSSSRDIARVLRGQSNLITRSQALAAGMTESALRHRLRPGGPWMVVLPGIYLAHQGTLTVGQRQVAAVLHGGEGCFITGLAALWHYGIRVPYSETIDVLVRSEVKRQSAGFVEVHRTFRMPDRAWQVDGLPFAPLTRAVGDAARWLGDVRTVRALVADAVQLRRCTIAELIGELKSGPPQGSANFRTALEEVADGIASVAEGDLRALIRRSGLPGPMYNPRLYVGSVFLAEPDAWWPEAGLAGEVDSREWHLSPEAWKKTMARHARMTAQGILVLHFNPGRLRSEPQQVIAELKAAYQAGLPRPRLQIRAIPSR